MVTGLPALPGTYALLLRSQKTRQVTIGRLGELLVQPGWYVYVGSALGPGGLAARLGRHLCPLRCAHWHIDHLRAAAQIVAICYATGGDRCECAWVRVLACLPGASIPLPGFGSSDCTCTAHLVRFEAPPLAAMRRFISPESSRLCWIVLNDQEGMP